ncbi:MAG TPA: DnaJ domain-containing protein [Sphingomicrobium sp.]|nr:DnaJ domain-containing protein [Sphingomicrobium sp.]
MASSLRSLSNHYDTLQVAPDATTDEIVRAFSSQMRSVRVRPDITVARLAQLTVAYETLRNPAKRRDYDASLGLGKVPFGLSQYASATAGPGLLERLDRGAEQAARAAPPISAQPATSPSSEARVATFIAASIRQPLGRSEQQASPPPLAEAVPQSRPETVPEISPTRMPEAPEIEDGQLRIGRTGATLAAAVIGVGILTFAMALPDRNPDRLAAPVQAQPAVTVALPPDVADQSSVAAPHAIEQVAARTVRSMQRRTRNIAVAAEAPSAAAPAAIEQPAEQGTALDTAQPKSSDVAATEAVAQAPLSAGADEALANSASTGTSVAALPLSSATIARTIERIGYGCGRVVSTASLDGAPGAYKISCSSGQVYRAAPVHGRYHFRRWGGR